MTFDGFGGTEWLRCCSSGFIARISTWMSSFSVASSADAARVLLLSRFVIRSSMLFNRESWCS